MSNIYDNVLITGGGGMLAHALAQSLRARGYGSLLLDKNALDITSPDSVRDALGRAALPSVILNCAAFTKVDLCETEPEAAYSVNANGAQNVAQWGTMLCAQRIVHFSTDFVFDGKGMRPYRPSDPTAPLSVYGASKLAGERAFGPHDLVIRTSWLYGPSGPNFVQTMLNAARAGKPLTVVDDQIGSPTFTHDLAEATLDLLDRGARGIYHATNSGQTSWFEFAKAIFEEFDTPNVDLKPISSAKWKEQRPTSAIRPAYSVLDCSATEQLIGRPMPHWREALHRYRLEVENPKSEIRNPKQ
jgi:dTDP-4-dehydrorhamnose reductase